MRRALAWLRRRWHLLLLALSLLVGVELLRRGRVLRTLRDELALERARSNIEGLRTLRDSVGALAETNSSVIERIDAEIYEQRVEAVRAYEEGAALTGEDLERAFAELGF